MDFALLRRRSVYRDFTVTTLTKKKNIIASLLKFAGYIHNHKVLAGNIFGLILKNKMTAIGFFFVFQH